MEVFYSQWVSLAGVGIVALVSTIYLQVFARMWIREIYTDEGEARYSNLLLFGFLLPGMLLWSPAFEELVFRLPLLVLQQYVTLPALVFAMVVSAILFGPYHMIMSPGFIKIPDDILQKRKARGLGDRYLRYQVRNAVPLGMIFSVFVLASGALWTGVIVHAAWNSIVLTYWMLRRRRTAAYAAQGKS